MGTNFIELLINVGVITTIYDRWPTEVQENWVERLQYMNQWARDQTREAQEFASSYDEP